MRSRATWLLLVVSALSSQELGCTATPIPQPPPENLDVGKIRFPETWPATTGIEFYGDPGAAPPDSIIRITNLDSTDSPAIIQVANDGSFTAMVTAELLDELRFQVRVDDERKPPIDLVFTGSGFTAGERADCFVVAPESDHGTTAIDVTSDAEVELVNDCPGDAAIGLIALRTGDPTFEVTTTPPPTGVPGDGTVTLDTSFTPSTTGENEEVLLIALDVDAQTVRYPVTLFGRGE